MGKVKSKKEELGKTGGGEPGEENPYKRGALLHRIAGR